MKVANPVGYVELLSLEQDGGEDTVWARLDSKGWHLYGPTPHCLRCPFGRLQRKPGYQYYCPDCDIYFSARTAGVDNSRQQDERLLKALREIDVEPKVFSVPRRQELLAFAGFRFVVRDKAGEIQLATDDQGECFRECQRIGTHVDCTEWCRHQPGYGTPPSRLSPAPGYNGPATVHRLW